ncbi:beta-lactamase/transpeptidase-like protein [Hyaloscypha bicolor E]|uniref:Beta-lactamase/transpeptidase-like protein n=1 Tax=Hyaloscypha bicolor E TaxID=1095630 RepID=A0A2J6TAD3_9HELO|nr:beta-lactamase/transpeptidase-like protein [Hyaloscypha bicolor E]PMD59980.1 beta-lactamase/transpeptidase-like protein [Hyaloscypha bicolor E]
MKTAHISFILAVPSLALARCPPTGPVLPPPSNLQSLDLSTLANILDGLSSGNNTSKWNSSTTSISTEITSANSTFFTYNYTAPVRNESGVGVVDNNTIFRVASVTNVFTVLAVLLENNVKMEDLVSEFIPELNDPKWAEVSIGMLTSQISGTPRDEFFNLLLQDDLSWQPGDRAAYSDIAYILLGYALENTTGIPYTQLVSNKITSPLKLQNTGFDLPSLSKAIVPVGLQWFTNGFDYYKATAGLYSTTHDLSIFLRAILNSTLLTPPQTRAWLKPHAFTSSTNAVGAPWEIYRPSSLTPTPRYIDHYTKQGNVPGYSALIIVVPEYEVGVAIAVAGEDAYTASIELFNAVEAELQALAKYGGRYVSGNSSLEVTIDSGPGMKIPKWTNLGKDMLFAFDSILFDGNGTMLDARVYPVSEGERWRTVFEEDGRESGEAVTSTACMTWEAVDQLRYAGLPCDEVNFQAGGRGEIVGVKIPGLRAHLYKD